MKISTINHSLVLYSLKDVSEIEETDRKMTFNNIP